MTDTLTLKYPSRTAESAAEGGFVNPLVKPSGVQVVEASYANAARSRRMFIGNMAAAGAVLPIFTNTTQVCGLWNPAGSGINVELVRINMTWVDTTGAVTGYCLGLTLGAPASLGAPITAFTDGVLNTSIFNARLGSSAGPTARFTPSAATVTAPIMGLQLGINQDVAAATAAVTIFNNQATYSFDGTVILPPGTAVWLAGNIAGLKKIAASIIWAEEAA